MACHVLDKTEWMTNSTTLPNTPTAMCEKLGDSRTRDGHVHFIGLWCDVPL